MTEKRSDTYLLKQVGKRKAKRADNNMLTHKKTGPDRLRVLASKKGRNNYFLKQRKNNTHTYIGMETMQVNVYSHVLQDTYLSDLELLQFAPPQPQKAGNLLALIFSLWVFLCTFQEETVLYKQIHHTRKLAESFSAVLQAANNLACSVYYTEWCNEA